MKTKLEDFIKENREAFDIYTPPNLWENINKGMQEHAAQKLKKEKLIKGFKLLLFGLFAVSSVSISIYLFTNNSKVEMVKPETNSQQSLQYLGKEKEYVIFDQVFIGKNGMGTISSKIEPVNSIENREFLSIEAEVKPNEKDFVRGEEPTIINQALEGNMNMESNNSKIEASVSLENKEPIDSAKRINLSKMDYRSRKEQRYQNDTLKFFMSFPPVNWNSKIPMRGKHKEVSKIVIKPEKRN